MHYQVFYVTPINHLIMSKLDLKSLQENLMIFFKK